MIRAKEIVLVPLDKIQLNPENRNKHPEAQIARLVEILKYQGFRRPVTISTRTGYLNCGEGRYLAAKELGLSEIPAMHQDYDTPEQEYADAIADNAVDKWAELDLAAINLDATALPKDFNLDLLGIKDFSLTPIKNLPGIDEDSVPEPGETRCNPGDVWLLNHHRLMCGDATRIDQVQLLANQPAQMVWTDPPYNVAYQGKTKDALTIQNDSQSSEDFAQFLTDAFIAMYAATEPGGAIYVAHADTEGYNFRGSLIKAGWLLKQCLVWNKNALVMGRQDYHWKHEPILYGWKDGAAHNWYSDRKQTTVIDFDKPSKSLDHPTMKPVGLVEYFLNNSSKSGDRVLDLFGGSGTTLIACEKTNRTCFMMELDPKYCDVILKRWEEYSGHKAVLDGNS